MKYKMLIMDVDNTLLSTDKTVSEKNQKAIDRCIENGIVVSLASGRPAADVMIFAEGIGVHENYSSSDNGAGIFKGEESWIIRNFDKDYYDHLCDFMDEHGIEYASFDAKNKQCICPERCEIIPETIQIYFPVTKVVKGDPKAIEKPYKISAWFRDDEELELLRTLEGEGKMNGVIPDPHWFDMMPYGLTKVVATEEIAKRYGFSMDEIIAMGDQQNDETNIRGAGLGVAVANAVPESKAAADVVLEQSCDDDAVAYVVNKYIFGEE